MEKSPRVSNTYALASTLNYMRFSPENLLVHSKREGSQLGDRESAQKNQNRCIISWSLTRIELVDYFKFTFDSFGGIQWCPFGPVIYVAQ